MHMPQKLKRRDLTERDLNLLVALRYGSLTDYSRVINSYQEISRQTGLHPNTIYQAVTRYHRNGDCYRKAKLGRRPRHLLTDAQKALITSSRTLEATHTAPTN